MRIGAVGDDHCGGTDMELYIGGTGQGKLHYVQNKKNLDCGAVADGAVCDEQQLLQAAIINQFHLYLRRLLQEHGDVEACLRSLLAKNASAVLIMDEVGCGIVPLDAFERQYREVVGRVGCRLAQEASHVERIVCGLGQVLK